MTLPGNFLIPETILWDFKGFYLGKKSAYESSQFSGKSNWLVETILLPTNERSSYLLMVLDKAL